MSDVKPRVLKAIEGYEARLRAQNKPKPLKKNNKPEKIVEDLVLAWCRGQDWDVSVYESSTYDPKLGRKGISKLEAGHSDLGGLTPIGLACYIELKAKGRLGTLSEKQRLFLERKIARNSFAVVTDSVERLETLWLTFSALQDPVARREFLTKSLPPRRERPDNDLGF